MIPTPASLHDALNGSRYDNADSAIALRAQSARQFGWMSVLLLAMGIGTQVSLNTMLLSVPSTSMLAICAALWTFILVLAWRGLAWHPYRDFGPANSVTLFRSAGTVLIASLVPIAERLPTQWLWVVTVLAVLLLSLDGIDGYLARRTQLASGFGARFDMEIDALLILTVSVFLWQSGEVGLWIISLGLMRYAFVLASFFSLPLQAELFPSFRRKLVCVIQVVALCLILSPAISAPLSSLVGLVALICLSGSFARDILWLYRHQSREGTKAAHRAPGTVATIDTSP